jgi:hypothetical protein
MKLLMMQFSPSPYNFFLDPNIFLSLPSSLSVGQQASQHHKAGKKSVLTVIAQRAKDIHHYKNIRHEYH